MKNLLFACLLFITFCLHATHNRSGEILYRRVAPYYTVVGTNTVPVYTYSFTIIKYMDNGMNVADRCVDTLYFGDGQKGIASRINGPAGNCGCPNNMCGEIIASQGGYIVKKNIYTVQHTYAVPGNYTVYSKDPYRTPGSNNIPNSGNQMFYIESMVRVSDINNSSPILSNAPVEIAVPNTPYYHHTGAYDEDGDSLSYEIRLCYRDVNTPIGSYPPGTFSIHPVNGLLTWLSPNYLGQSNMAIVIKEWRRQPCAGSYSLLGYVVRDMEVMVTNTAAASHSFTGLTDTCIVAGTNYNRSLALNSISTTTLSLIGSCVNTPASPFATISPTTGAGDYSTTISWNTTCLTSAPYPFQLVAMAEWTARPYQKKYAISNIKIVPPAPAIASVSPALNQVTIKWNKVNAGCNPQLKGYNIYRKTGTNNWSHSACESGVPGYSGFILRGFVPASDTTFTDDLSFQSIPEGSTGYYIVTTLMNNCSESFANINSLPLIIGMKENLLENSFSLSPNPFANYVKISVKDPALKNIGYTVFSADGRMLLYETRSNPGDEFSIDLSDLPKGLYFIQFRAGNGTVTKKIVKD